MRVEQEGRAVPDLSSLLPPVNPDSFEPNAGDWFYFTIIVLIIIYLIW
jgi:hypothetical protein